LKEIDPRIVITSVRKRQCQPRIVSDESWARIQPLPGDEILRRGDVAGHEPTGLSRPGKTRGTSLDKPPLARSFESSSVPDRP
jgi:hypothetical protein